MTDYLSDGEEVIFHITPTDFKKVMDEHARRICIASIKWMINKDDEEVAKILYEDFLKHLNVNQYVTVR